MTSLSAFNAKHQVTAQIYDPAPQKVVQVDQNSQLQRQEQSLVEGHNPLLYYVLMSEHNTELGRGVLQRHNWVERKMICHTYQHDGWHMCQCYCCIALNFDSFIQGGDLKIHYESKEGPMTQSMLIDSKTPINLKAAGWMNESTFCCLLPCLPCWPKRIMNSSLRVYTKPF